MNRLFLAASAAILIATSGVALAQPAPAPAPAAVATPTTAAERKAVVEDLAKALEADFVYPATGAKYAAMLRANLAAGAYDGLADPAAFGEKVTADLQAVAKDGHLRLAPVQAFERPRPAPAGLPASTKASGPPGLEETKMIGDVAYLRFNQFTGDPGMIAKARGFLTDHADAKAVILDARPHRGGGLDEMDALLPLLYAKKTALVRMEVAKSLDDTGPVQDGTTLVRVKASAPTQIARDHTVIPDKAETRLQRVPVYYLTSRRTASAAEHLALAFKRTHRATLIGETTRGAGHFGGLQTMGGERFAAFIPVGRTYDPDTGWDWEGKGVAPDVPTGADEALDEALKRARAAGAHPTD